MTQTRLVVIIYIIGILIGAFVFDLWGAETSAIKSLAAMFWTALSVSYTHLTLPTAKV